MPCLNARCHAYFAYVRRRLSMRWMGGLAEIVCKREATGIVPMPACDCAALTFGRKPIHAGRGGVHLHRSSKAPAFHAELLRDHFLCCALQQLVYR